MANTTELLEEIRQVAQVAAVDSADLTEPNSEVFTDEGILSIATRELRGHIAPMIMKEREEYLLSVKDFVAEQGTRYRIPERAIGAKLRDVTYIDASGYERGLPRLNYRDVEDDEADGFYLDGGMLVLRSNVTGTVRMRFYVRPSKLVVASRVGTIDSYTAGLATVTLTGSVPTAMQAVGTQLDFIRANSPYDIICGNMLSEDTSSSPLSLFPGEGELEFGRAADVEVGDFVAIAGETHVPQIPDDLWPYLVLRTGRAVCEAIGDDAGVNRISKHLKEFAESLPSIIAPRVDARPQKIVNKKLFGGR
jgi:hypothetical protein